MSRKKRCGDRHPDLNVRCELRAHAYGKNHAVYRGRETADHIEWENPAPCICKEKVAAAEAYVRRQRGSSFPGLDYVCPEHGHQELLREPTLDEIAASMIPFHERSCAGHIPISQLPGHPALFEATVCLLGGRPVTSAKRDES